MQLDGLFGSHSFRSFMGRPFALVRHTCIHTYAYLRASHRFVRRRSFVGSVVCGTLAFVRLIVACFEQARYVCVVRVRVDCLCCGSEPSGEGDVRAGGPVSGALAVTVSTVSQVGWRYRQGPVCLYGRNFLRTGYGSVQ